MNLLNRLHEGLSLCSKYDEKILYFPILKLGVGFTNFGSLTPDMGSVWVLSMFRVVSTTVYVIMIIIKVEGKEIDTTRLFDFLRISPPMSL